MIRQLALAAVLVSASSVATAAETTAYYAATPAAVPEQTTLIANGMLWKWNAPAYVADKSGQRAGIVCATVAQRAGKLAAFSAGGEAFDADALAKCNARAK
jgi:hypothetical protein